jgi:hypothetical protein
MDALLKKLLHFHLVNKIAGDRLDILDIDKLFIFHQQWVVSILQERPLACLLVYNSTDSTVLNTKLS